MENMINGLRECGLIENEAKVYSVLLDEKSATGGVIAAKAGIERHYVYDILDSLKERGFVTYIKRNNIKYYQPAGIHLFADTLKQRISSLNSLVPVLLSHEKGVASQEIAIFEGTNGIKMILRGALEQCKGKEIVGFGDNGMLGSVIFPEYMQTWHDRRIANRIRIRSIFIDTPEAVSRMKEASKLKLMKVKVLHGPFNHHLSAWVSGETTIVWILTDRPFAVVVNSRKVADGFRGYFEALWGLAKEK